MDVLVVEDNVADVDLIREMLPESESFNLSPVPRLAEALDALEERAFEAVLLDLGLPDSQGLETLSRLRRAVESVPIVISSGLSDAEVAVEAMRLGAHDYVVKGRFDGAHLIRTLRYAVARARVESVVRENQDEYRQQFDLHPHPTWLFDPTTLGFLAVNDAAVRLYGWSREQMLSMSVEALIPSDARERFRASLDGARGGETRVLGADLPWTHLTRSGARREVELTIAAVPFRGASAFLGVSTDVSAQRRLQRRQQTERKLEALGRLAGGAAHDFNDTLGTIMGYAEMILGDEAASHATRTHADRIFQVAQASSGLARQLLAFGRRQVFKEESVDLNALVADFVSLFRRSLGPGLQVVSNSGPGVGSVRADPIQLHQVLLNLAANARDAMPAGGALVIETSNVDVDAAFVRSHPAAHEGAFVELLVGDTGRGMDEETRAHLYEPFYTTRAADGGAGLGLATVYGIVQQSGGFIDVYSEPGRGTIFRVFLPRAESRTPPVARRESPGGELPGGSETVLVVESTEVLREFLREILEDAGYEVIAADGPERALEQAGAREGPIHLVLTDLMLPGMSGLQMVERLASVRPETRALYISSYTRSLPHEDHALTSRARLLVKPFSAADLLYSSRAVLDEPDAPPHRGRAGRRPSDERGR